MIKKKIFITAISFFLSFIMTSSNIMLVFAEDTIKSGDDEIKLESELDDLSKDDDQVLENAGFVSDDKQVLEEEISSKPEEFIESNKDLDTEEEQDPEVEEVEVKEPKVEEPKVEESKTAEIKAEEKDAKAEKKAQSVEKVETEDVEEEEDELAENYPAIATPAIPMPMMRMAKSSGGLEDTIAVTKTAERTKDEEGNICGCRTFEVNLNITGEPQQAPVDVVLVIDKSGSMNERVGGYGSNTRLYYAKQAAVNFAGRVLGPNGIPGSRVSVVSFSGPEYATGGWFDPQRHYGQQNQATTNLDLSSDLTTVTNRINSITAVGGTNTEAGFKQGQSVIQGSTSNQNPNSNKVVIMLTDGLPTASNGNPYAETTNINHVHIQSAINAGKNIYQNDIADVFTIGLTTGMNATEKALADNILTQAQNKGYYPAPSATDLDAIFNAISQSLGYAATNAKVVDKIGDNFDLIESSLPAGATYNAATREITWNPGTIVTGASLTYKVVAKPDFPGGPADTNEFAKLTYKDIFGVAGKTKDFPVPNVNVPTLIKVSLTDATINSGDSINLGSGTDADGENYMSPVTGGDNNGTTFTYEWRKVGDPTVITGGKNPSVSPTEDTEYEVTVTDSNGCKAIATMMVRVKKLSNIKVTKIGDNGEKLEGAEFTLYHKEGDIVNIANNPQNTGPNGEALFSGVKNGEYTVKETAAPTGYVMDTESKDVTVSGSGVTVEVTFTNSPIKGNIEVEKRDENGNLLAGGEFTLYKDGVAVTGIENPKTTDATGKIRFDNLDYGIYTVKETAAPVGYILDPKTETVTIENNLETITIEFVNNLITADIKIIKVKDTEDGDRIEGAMFELRDEAGLVVRGPLTTNIDGEILMENIPYGEYTLHETKAAAGYKRLREPIDVVVNGEEETIELRIINTENTWQIPNTGGYGGISFSIIGLSIMVLAGAIFIREYTRKIKVRS